MKSQSKTFSLLKNDPLWYKDAVIYQVHVKSFCDSNGDGIGDFNGLAQKLDYLETLGISALWLLPFYPSPQRDDGYDIADYFGIHPSYGTLRDFKNLLREAHRRGIRVITELVINHTSDKHAWFQRARNAPKESPWRNFYVWSDSPEKYKDARIIFQDFEHSNWAWDQKADAYYWHRFYSHQPDLNFENPKVHEAVFKVIDYWMEMGVDGMRLDAVPYLYEEEGTNCENLPKTYEFLRKLRSHIDKKHKNKMLLAEANQWPEDAAAYFGEDGGICNMNFHFPLMPRMYMALQMEDWFPIVDILEQTPQISEQSQWAIFLRNHDELTLEMVTDEERDYMYRYFANDPSARINLGIRRRLAPLLGKSRRRIELMNILLFSLPGTPIIYYGDEIGMGDNHYLGDRNGVRTPMQWSNDRNAGFSKANPQKLFLPVIIDPEYHYQTVNVEIEDANATSLLWWMRRVINMRARYTAFARGEIHFIHTENSNVFAFVRSYEEETILVVINLSRFSQVVELDLEKYAGMQPIDVFSKGEFPPITSAPYMLTMGFHDYFWLKLETQKALAQPDSWSVAELDFDAEWTRLFSGKNREYAENQLFSDYISVRKNSGRKSPRVRSVKIVDALTVRDRQFVAVLLLLKVRYTRETSDMLFLPLSSCSAEAAQFYTGNNDLLILAHLRGKNSQYIIDATYIPEFHQVFYRLIRNKKKFANSSMTLSAEPLSCFKRTIAEPKEIYLEKAGSRNTSFTLDNGSYVKIFRRIEKGINPDVEVTNYVSSMKSKPQMITQSYGQVVLQHKKDNYVIAMVNKAIENTGLVWSDATQNAIRFLDEVITHRDDSPAPRSLFADLLQPSAEYTISDHFEHHTGVFIEQMSLLGTRLSQLHILLAENGNSQNQFSPEQFTMLYQRSLYQRMQSRVKKTFDSLQRKSKKMDEIHLDLANKVLKLREPILSVYKTWQAGKFLAKKSRIHGDLHLGQVLHSANDFVFKDFEGRGDRALSERRIKRSALRDLASLVQSLHWAGARALYDLSQWHEKDISFLEGWLQVWYAEVSNPLISHYFEGIHDSALVPEQKEQFIQLYRIYQLHQAVTEIGQTLADDNSDPNDLKIALTAMLTISQLTEQ